jgi:hypothetical protein
MPGALDPVTIKDPTRYGALTMGGEQFTGLWTQRSPYRDAATAYLIKKFYQGSRFDSILDGINREITVRLTDARRPGTYVYNGSLFPLILGYYGFKSIQNGVEVIRLLAEGADANIYDFTYGSKTTLFSKSAGAGRMRFQSVGTTLYMADGVDAKKWLYPGAWAAATNLQPGTLISTGPVPGVLQMALGGITMRIAATQSTGTQIILYVNPQDVTNQFPNLDGVTMSFAGLTGATFLNGNSYVVNGVQSTTLGIFTIPLVHAVYAQTNDTGTCTSGNGTTGGGAPAFSAVEFTVIADAGQQWKCYGTGMQNIGLKVPTGAPVLTPTNGTRFWQPYTVLAMWYAILDTNNNVQVLAGLGSGGGTYKTGRGYPPFAISNPYTGLGSPNCQTQDGGLLWTNYGKLQSWQASKAIVGVIVDTNQNLQLTTSGTTGATEPLVWNPTIGGATADGTVSWTCLGPGVQLTTASVQYSYSTHALDGSVSTAAPVATIIGGIFGAVQTGTTPYIQITGAWSADTQIDQLWIWRTPQGQSTLVLEDQIPSDGLAGTFSYNDLGIPDTSANGGGALNALIPAPVASSNNPPPAGMTAPCWYLQRNWAIVANMVVYSGGPDTVTGNGATSFPPLNSIPFVGRPVKLRAVTVQNGALLVYTSSGMHIVLGTGTQTNPFYATPYADKINLGGYDAEDVLGTELFLMEANGKVSTIQVQYPFNPQSGYTEVGLPIGDQFLKVTTGGISSALYNPTTTYLSWNIANTRDTGMYVADGAVGWFRMGAVSPPESGLVWSPRAAIVGGTSAVQSIETSPGVFTLLIGPGTTNGPILARDVTQTVWNDNGTAYSAWDAKGVTLLCSTGDVAEAAWVATKSAAVGARPVISVLMGEIAATASSPWSVLQPTSPDPADQPRSQTVYSDRYSCQQGAAVNKSDCILTKFDYGAQAFGDELWEFAIYGAKDEERKEAGR